MAKRTAVIDIGSNSVRMVIFEKTSRFAFHLLHEAKSRVRISERAYENGGNLQEAPMQRALYALEEFRSIADSYHVRKTLCVATSAVRDAPNKSEFLSRARDLGLSIKVIDGKTEAYMGGIACANLLPKADGVTIDIGGGSTELAYIENGSVVASHSLDLGTVRLKELFFDRKDEAGAAAYIDGAIATLPPVVHGHAVGIGGTFRALSRAQMKRTRHPLQKLHAYQMDIGTMLAYLDRILEARNPTALKKIGVKKDRYDVIQPGALILSRLLQSLQIHTLTTSGVGVREGVYLADLLRNSNHRFPEHFNPSMRYLLDRYDALPHFSSQIASVSKKLFDLVHEDLGIDVKYRKCLGIAAKLCKIGNSVHHYSHNQHSYYLTQTALEYGFSHEEVMLISTLVRFQKKKRPAKGHVSSYDALLPEPEHVEQLSFLISLAKALLVHHPKNVDFSLGYDSGTITVTASNPLYLAQESVAALEYPEQLDVRFLCSGAVKN